MKKHLHIVCLDTPWPADYGGAIDMMNRIKMFHTSGISIHLHYFNYNERGTPNELNQFCESIHVYERKKKTTALSLKLPYIVSSRINQELISNLKKDDYPVLLEGLHCTGILSALDLRNRKIVVRMHNEESTYYKELAIATSSLIKKIYYEKESWLIKKYTRQLPDDCVYACLSNEDILHFKNDYQLNNVISIPIFPSWQNVTGEEGLGNLCLYHGNLSVPENERAAIWLLKNVFSKITKPLVIAGKNPSKRLQKMAHLYQHTCIVSNPSDNELNDLIRKAQINILPSLNKRSTGIKLKLLHALYEGRHCVVNEQMVAGTGLAPACHIANSAEAFASVIMQLFNQPFTMEEIRLREKLLVTNLIMKKIRSNLFHTYGSIIDYSTPFCPYHPGREFLHHDIIM